MARRIIGSPQIETSVAMQEIVPTVESWTVPVVFRAFTFMNSQACHIILNGNSRLDGQENRIFLRENQGLNIDVDDVDVKSFKIVEDGIQYNYVGKY